MERRERGGIEEWKREEGKRKERVKEEEKLNWFSVGRLSELVYQVHPFHVFVSILF